MLTYPAIDPIAIQLGRFAIHWYGLMYLIGFIGAWILARYRCKQPQHADWQRHDIDDVIFYAAIGVIIGGRVGYMLIYNSHVLFNDPISLLRLWQGGMSFHGGLIGALLALWVFSKVKHKSFFTITDFIAPFVPIGLAAGRIGNFINGELWGRVTNMPWGMVFPHAGNLPRHPSQLYEFLLEGVVLFVVLWWYSAKPKPKMAVSALFLIGYSIARIMCELFRQPDVQLGFLAFNWLTMGQLLSLPLLMLGIAMMVLAYKKHNVPVC